MQIPLKDRRPADRRTLASLERDYNQFCTAGGGNIKNAKHYNNVISQPLFKIPISQVTPLSLWISSFNDMIVLYFITTVTTCKYILHIGCTTWAPYLIGDIYENMEANGG